MVGTARKGFTLAIAGVVIMTVFGAGAMFGYSQSARVPATVRSLLDLAGSDPSDSAAGPSFDSTISRSGSDFAPAPGTSAILFYCHTVPPELYFFEQLASCTRQVHLADATQDDVDNADWTIVIATTNKACTSLPFYQDAVRKHHEAAQIALPAFLAERWVDNVYFPPTARSLVNRSAIFAELGEVFWHDNYETCQKQQEDVDIMLYRSSRKPPRIDCPIVHFTQAASMRNVMGDKWHNLPDVANLTWSAISQRAFCVIITGKLMKRHVHSPEVLIREALFVLLSEHHACDHLGRHSKPCNGTYLENHKCMNNYRFSINMENQVVDGYVSEKLLMGAMSPGTIPIYLGDPAVAASFNTERFLVCKVDSAVREKMNAYSSKKGLHFNFNNNSNPTDEELLRWAVDFLRPHLQSCVDSVLALNQDEAAFMHKIRQPLIRPENFPRVMGGADIARGLRQLFTALGAKRKHQKLSRSRSGIL